MPSEPISDAPGSGKLKDPDANAQRGVDAVARVKDLWRGVPEIGEQALHETLTADRAGLEARGMQTSAREPSQAPAG